MVRPTIVSLCVPVFTCGLLLPAAWAQQSSGIAGVVKDPSGAVLPGVTVDAASPILIEKVRTTVTDGEGRYNIVDLLPGTYTVTFTLTGFRTARREGIELTAGFTATVNADLLVGALEETVTVSGQTPLVDTRNVRRQTVASRDLLDTLPTSTKHIYTLVTLTAGFTGVADVGGRYAAEAGAFHGKRGTKVMFDGMGMENSSGNSSYQLNAAVVEEMVLQTSGISAEVNADGPVMNVVPKEGGNTFKVTLAGLYAGAHLESDNLTDALRARGLTEGNKTLKIFDNAASLGGPIKKDRLWFFGAMRSWGMARQMAGVYWNKTQDVALTPPGAERVVVLWTPWVDRPFDRGSGRWEWYDSYLGRVTWQTAPKHKLNFIVDKQEACNCGSTSAGSMQETQNGYRFDPNVFVQATWNSAPTNRLLLEAGAGASISQWNTFWMPGVQRDHVNITDQGLGISYGAAPTYRGFPNHTDRFAQRFSMSYVTGSHAFKTGVQIEELVTNMYFLSNGNVSYTFRNGVPVSILQRATPYLEKEEGRPELGLYAQDQWAINRWTLNLGLRFDYFRGYVPAQDLPGSPYTNAWPGAERLNPWVGERHFAEVRGIPSWQDLNPRLGASYDLFGDGRTALKVSLGRYVAKTNVDVPNLLNPINTSVNSVTRTWNDANRNYVPDCDLGNFAVNGECGAVSDQNFGNSNPQATRWADEVLRGWGVRDSNWDFSAEAQRELRAGLSVTAGYYRNTGGYYRNTDSKNRVTDNLMVRPSDFDPYCVTAPADPRLPGGGGYQVCGLYDVNPNQFGQVQNLVTRTSNYGEDKRVNDFVNVSVNARFGSGIRLNAGFDTGRMVRDACFVVDAPGLVNTGPVINGASSYAPHTATTINGQPTCRLVTPFEGNTQIKLNGSMPLPGGFVVSAVYQNLSGPAVEANYSAPTAEIAPSLGRNLAACGTRAVCTQTATVPLLVQQTMFEDRITRLDLRVSKIVKVGRIRLQANLDAYNALNASSILQVINAYGPRWLFPSQVLDPRIIQVSGQLTF